MARQNLIFSLLVLLAAEVMAERQHTITFTKTRFQQCNSSSCECVPRNNIQAFSKCTQSCGNSGCKLLKCSARTCYQECHNCQMECTSDVHFCRQRCLSGACSLKCKASQCVKQCNDGECESRSSNSTEYKQYQLVFPRPYLIILAVLLGLVAVLSLGLLVYLTCGCNCCKTRTQNGYFKLTSYSSSLESLDVKPIFV